MKKARILIVDDERDFATTLAERLNLRGYEAHVVLSPEDTLSTLQQIRPEIILLDLKLPGFSGIEILMTIRQISPEIEVILLTGHLDIERTIEGMRIDSFHYIMKPFDINELTAKIDVLRANNG